ncbi:MAG: EI24 domain-containing protein [Rickettsiales bacterium]|nr:EI24 domain-containing protein [Rickettsiales bacterium]
MGPFIAAAFRAVASLFTPGMIGVFIYSIIVSVVVLAAFFFAAVGAFDWAANAYALASYVPWLGSFGAGLVAWLLFPIVTPVTVSFFDVRITTLIEQHEYPGATPAAPTPFWPEFAHDVGFSLKALGLNVLVLPLYLLPGLNMVLFYLLNGYLLGREYFVMAARRHIPLAEAEALRRQHGGAVMMGGVLLTFLATIPVINLFAPFWGVAVMVHLYHILRQTPEQQVLPPR